MNPIQQIKSLLNVESIPKASMVALQPGQLTFGRVEKFLSGQKAVLQIGGTKIIADLRAPLSIGKGYWFEVVSNANGEIQLKTATDNGKENIHPSPLSLLNDFQLPETKNNIQLLEYFLAKGLPFTKDQLITAAGWVKNHSDLSKDLTALEFMVKKGLPFTIKTFQALLAVQDPASFSSQLVELSRFLDDDKFTSFKSIPPLKQLLASILEDDSTEAFDTGEKIKEMMETKIQALGLEFEKEVRTNDLVPFHSLKPLVLSAINELGTEGKGLEPVLNRLTGMQLISQDVTGPMQQMVMQLPIYFGERNTDVTIHWSGRKTKNGQIDPDYCRIIFYLELESLNLTMMDMHVQNRVVHLSIKNDSMSLEPIVNALTPVLKEKLEGLDYKLSFIKVIPSFENITKENQEIEPSHLLKDVYQGVDIKI